MDQNKVGQLILQLRKEHNLTQQAFADLFGVTYQAVSKWENGKSMPDILILKEICKKFNLDINQVLDGESIPKSKKFYLIIGIITLLIISLVIVLAIKYNSDEDFKFKTLSSECSNFNIYGSIAYNSSQSHIYISKIEYCGGNDITKYAKIECVLYESHDNKETRIDAFTTENEAGVTLEEFLQDLSFHIENYSAACKDFQESNLFLQIFATDQADQTTFYKIPLNHQTSCNNN